MGIMPQNAGGFGAIKEAMEVWAANELNPIQMTLMQINQWVRETVVEFGV